MIYRGSWDYVKGISVGAALVLIARLAFFWKDWPWCLGMFAAIAFFLLIEYVFDRLGVFRHINKKNVPR